VNLTSRARRVLIAISLVGACVIVAVLPASPTASAQAGTANGAKPATILFMCPHGAAKIHSDPQVVSAGQLT
jgi:hypothetical protein